MTDATNPALKEIFNRQHFTAIAKKLSCKSPGFDMEGFLCISFNKLDELSIMQRVCRMSQTLHATLPGTYRSRVAALQELASSIPAGFGTFFLPYYVGQYGEDDFDFSMGALAFFTRFGSSEFDVHEFILKDQSRALSTMEAWSRDADEHIRRLAYEGSRPRLPWSFRLDAIARDPLLTVPILENLCADPSLYVRKSVANHLNDVTKLHPDWVLARLSAWPTENPHTAWIVKRALRSMIKAGNTEALTEIGASGTAQVAIRKFSISPRRITLGERVVLALNIASVSSDAQRLVVDYKIDYVKKSGATSDKVFKLKEILLAKGQCIRFERTQEIKHFSARTHYSGRHDVEILVNRASMATASFDLDC